MFYPPAIREDATPSSEVQDAPKGVEVASPSTAPEIISPQMLAKESGPSGMAGADEGQGPDVPKETAGSISGDLVSHIEGPVIVIEPFQSILLAEGSKDPEASPTQPSLKGISMGYAPENDNVCMHHAGLRALEPHNLKP